MTSPHDSKFLDDPEFQSLLVACMESLQRGETIDRDALAKDFPKFAAEVAQFLNDRRLLEQIAPEFEDVEPSQVAIAAYEKTISSNSGSDDFTAGDTIRYIGEYEILEEIARGGMGVVFKARQQKLKRIVALKMILAGRLADSSDVERFQREARAAGRLKHANIVPVHEIGEHEGRHYFTMDFVEGRSLAEAIREGTLAPRTAAALVRTAGEAVQYAHEQGTIHRDLKPANVLLDTAGQPQITDFGLAKLLESVDEESRADLTASGQILGTPSYMSPEQAAGRQNLVGPASDIYSLGAILYACLTGRAPFVADSPVDTLLQVMRKEPVSPRLLNPAVCSDLETICLKCLTKEPSKRYGTAQELADDLQRFLEHRPISARPAGTIEKTARWCRRNPAVAALLLLVGLSMITGTAVSTHFAIAENRRATSEAAERLRANEQTEIAENAQRKTSEALSKEAVARTLAEKARGEAERQKKAAEREQQVAQQAQQRAEQAQQSESQQRKLAEEARRLAQWQTYVARIQPLQQASQHEEWGHLDRLLHEMIPQAGAPDFRGWEWYFFDAQVRSVTPQLSEGHDFSGRFVHDVPRERLFAWSKGKLSIWDLKSRKLSSTLSLPALRGETVKLSPDGRLLAGGDWQSRVLVWDIESDHRVAELVAEVHPADRKNEIRTADTVWSPDGSRLLTASRRGEIRVWNTNGWKLERVLQQPSHRNTMGAMDWHPDGGLLTGHRFGWFRVWDVDAGKVIHTGQCRGSIIEYLKWNPAGDRFALVTDGIGIYTAEGKQIGEHIDCGLTSGLTWLNDDELVVGGAEQCILLIDADSATVKHTVRVHSGEIKTLSKWDDDVVLSSSVDGSLRFSEIRQSSPGVQRITAHKTAANEVEWSPDGSKLATAGNDGLAKIWDASSLTLQHELNGHSHSIVWDVAWNNGGDHLATIDHAGGLNLYAGARGTLLQQATMSEVDFPRLDWRPSNEFLILGGSRPQIVDAVSLKSEWQVDKSEGAWRTEMHFSPDGLRAAGYGANGGLHLVDVKTQKLIFRRYLNDPGTGAGAWSPDGKLFVAAGTDLTILESRSFQEIVRLEGHRGPVGGVCFNPSGTRIASAGSDGMVYLWDVATGNLLTRIPILDAVALNAIEWSPDGKQLAMVSAEGELIVLGSAQLEVHENQLEIIDPGAMKLEEELASLSVAIQREPEKMYLYTKRADWYAQHLAYDKALADLERYLEKQPQSGWQRCNAAYAAFAIGDEDAYVRHHAVNMDKLPKYDFSGEGGTKGFVVSAACLRSVSNEHYELLLPLAIRFREANPMTFHPNKPLIMLKLRTGDFTAVLSLLEPHRDRNQFLNEQILVDSMRAIALHHLDRMNEARESLTKAESTVRYAWPAPRRAYDAAYGDLGSYVEARQFLKEARELVEPVGTPGSGPTKPSGDSDAGPGTEKDQSQNIDKAESINASPEPKQQQSVIDRLGAEDSEVRIETLQELMRLNADAVFALPALLEMLQQPVSFETVLVIRCLGNIGPQAAQAVPRLDEILKGNAAAQNSGADNLTESHEKRINEVPVSGLRFDAAAAMARMGPVGEVAIPTLIEMLKNPGDSVKTYLDGKPVGAPEAEGYAALLYRRDETGVDVDQRDRDLINVIRCLANFGPAAKDAAPAIEAVRDDSDTLASVVEMATVTLMAIQGEGTE